MPSDTNEEDDVFHESSCCGRSCGLDCRHDEEEDADRSKLFAECVVAVGVVVSVFGDDDNDDDEEEGNIDNDFDLSILYTL